MLVLNKKGWLGFKNAFLTRKQMKKLTKKHNT
jgi:hypothetical protein